MLFLQQGPAETNVYMIAGYSVIFGVMLVYLVSLVVRRRKKTQDLADLLDLDKTSQESTNKSYGIDISLHE
jgi:hypothetical protein